MFKNVAGSLLSYGTNLVIAFFLSPYILKSLGDTRYGIWALFGEMLTYYGLLDLGVRGALSYFVGKSFAEKNDGAIQEYVNSAFFGLTVIATAALAVSSTLVWIFQDELGAGTIGRTEVLSSAIFFLFIFCLSLPLEVFSAVLVGHRKLYLVNGSEIGARTVSTILMFVLLALSPSLIALAFTQLIGKAIYWGLLLRNVRKHVPQLEWKLKYFSRTYLRKLLTIGGHNSVANLSWLLITRKDVIVITMFWGPSVVPVYAFARLLVQNVTTACSSVTLPLRPNMVHHWADGDRQKAFEVYYKGARYSAFVAAMLVAFLAALGHDFIRLWIGERFVTGSWLFRTDVILIVLLLANLPRLMHSISWQLLQATANNKGLTVLLVTEALLNTGLSFLLIKPYGALGLAIATLIPMVPSHVFGIPYLLKRSVGVPMRRYITEGVARPLLAAAVVFAAGLGMRLAIPIASWLHFFVEGSIAGIIALVLGWFFVATPGERNQLMGKISRRPVALQTS